jgi:predicted secreted protein
MSLTLAIALYFIIWWTILFAVLPFGVRTQGEAGDVVPGTPESAPVAPRLVRIAVVTSIAAAAILVVVYLVLRYQVIDIDIFAIPSSLPSRRQ